MALLTITMRMSSVQIKLFTETLVNAIDTASHDADYMCLIHTDTGENAVSLLLAVTYTDFVFKRRHWPKRSYISKFKIYIIAH